MSVRYTETDRKVMSILRKFLSEEELNILIKKPSRIKEAMNAIKTVLK